MSTLTRRNVLQCLGGLLLLPSLEACRSESSPTAGRQLQIKSTRSGLSGPPAKRFIAFGLWDGVRPDAWFPTGSESAFTLAPMLTPLATHQANMILTKGIDNAAAAAFSNKNGHIEGVSSFLSGRAPLIIDIASNQYTGGGITVDQEIAKLIEASGTLTRFGSYQLGVSAGGGGYGAISYSDARKALDADTSADNAFSTLFADADKTKEEIARARATKQSILDGSKADYTRLSSKVSGEDKRRIEAHLEAIREIEKRLAIVVECSPNKGIVQPGDRGMVWTSMIDIAVLAMACDLTRVMTFTFDHAGGGGPQFPWLGINDDIHELSHSIVGEPNATDAASVKFIKIHQWYAERISTMVDKMKATITPEGTLFDETVIFRGSELSLNHATPDMPFLILAGDKTPFRTGPTGRYVQVGPKAPHNNLLVTLLHAFGGTAPTFGDPTFSTGNFDAELLKA